MEHTLGEDEHAIGDIEGLTPEEVQELEDLVIEQEACSIYMSSGLVPQYHHRSCATPPTAPW